MEQTAPAPQQIPTPPDFPVTWPQPEMARAFWTRETMHFPQQVPPMTAAVARRFFVGTQKAAAAYAFPIRLLQEIFNSYAYQSVVPAVPHEEMEAQGKRAEEALGGAMATLGARWRDEYLPEIQQFLAMCDGFDLASASDADFLAHYDRVLAESDRLWEIHFLLAFSFLMPMSLLSDLCADLFGERDDLSSLELVQGLDNKTLAGDRALWRLGRAALADPAVRAVFETRASADVIPALETTDAGRAFLAQLRAYLDEYGRRGSHFFDFDLPTWIEDPAPVLRSITEYMDQPERDPDADLAAQAARREERRADARAQLAGYPQQVREQFEFILKAASEATVLSEDHNYWIDCRAMYEVRRVIVEAGRRLVAARVIAAREDIFLLTLDEARAALADSAKSDYRGLVAERKAEMARWAAVQSPPVLGTEPPGPPPDNAMGRAIGRFFGGPPQPMTEPGVLRGNAGSKGVARGTAKVVRTLAEAGKLMAGDILVTETTAPPWTPLFARVAAVVTDTGGVLSHCAVVAREYMIPAVVGIGMATHVIHDGMTIEVDGTAGVVRIIDAS